MNKVLRVSDIAFLNKETYKKGSFPRFIKYLDTGNLTKNKIDSFQILDTAKDKIPSRAQRKTKRDTILYSTVRPNQEHYGYIEKEIDGLVVSTGFTTIDVFDKSISPKYLYYLLTQNSITEYLQILGTSGVSAYPSISPYDIGNLKFKFPSKKNQDRIVRVLSDLDTKIELNNKINTELEAMAKLIYDYWFVQFDFPFDFAQGKPRENGKPYKSSGGKMEFNAELKREIPVGWEDGFFGDLGEIVTGGTPSTKNRDYFTEDGIAWISPKDLSISKNKYIDKGATDITELGLNNSSAKLMPENSILLTTRAPIGYIGVSLNEVCTNQGFKSIVPFDRFGVEYVYYTVKFNVPHLQKIGVGSTFKEISKEVFSNVKTVIPDKKVLELFISKINPLSERIKIAEKENKELSKLRDWLLPMLMNGQVTVGTTYKNEEEQLRVAAEPEIVYEKEQTAIDTLFETLNWDYEVAAIQVLTQRRFGFTYGKKYTHKMFSNIELLNTMPKFKELAFKEKGWGMFSKAIAKTIDTQKFIYFHRLDHGAEVLKVRPNATKEIMTWMGAPENKDFVTQVNQMLDLYEKPLINRDMDRIELLNTVLECMKVIETDNLQAIRDKMAMWKMEEEYNKTKAEKFSENETLHMIGFVKPYIKN
ncbi:restriction endonuclease subunit S [Arenibacter sp. N53]|uniref:restriction endonuclease subunit S n=1 Tax=Arenibacter TaxID=178469 RepID=UPI000CD3C48A|nr:MULTISPECIES: restriction endonuclease subunit S [Arenibacter]MCM4150311.1 restriction endonuclease subunit S [Arenibacter sp. N53]